MYLCTMNLEVQLKEHIISSLNNLFGNESLPSIQIEKTKPVFEGDYTLVVFPLVRFSKKSPEETAKLVGEQLIKNKKLIQEYNVIKGFLNLVINPQIWLHLHTENWDSVPAVSHSDVSKIMVEYSSPNTNKPLHLGHIRNNLLGYSISQILKSNGHDVIMANLINDRGIHICKSMLAWQRFGNNETPENSKIKGDHLVGKYYVVFENELQKATEQLVAEAKKGNWTPKNSSTKERYTQTLEALEKAKEQKQINKLEGQIKEMVRNESELMISCQQMLRDWESGDPEVLALWEKMNGWVYEGFDHTYKSLGVSFDKYYYESNTYKLGKDLVQEGLESGVFFQKEDGSVWIDLSADGLDEKLVQRSDGTSVYITQDMGTADLKYEDFKLDRSVYVVGNEQDYHFKVLFSIMKKLNRSYANGMYHASYGMVDLPSGKMKSREGTVVDADDLIQDMIQTAKQKTEELGKTEGMDQTELDNLYYRLALAALKFFILKVDPKKRMLFNPEESIDFHGDTGPFVMYTYARIQSMLSKADNWKQPVDNISLHPSEVSNIKILNSYEEVILQAGKEYSPALICQFVLDVAKSYNRVYNEVDILRESNTALRNFRLQLAHKNALILRSSLALLGIETVNKM